MRPDDLSGHVLRSSEVDAEVTHDAVGVNIGAPGAGVGHANGRMLGNLADDAETEVDLPP